MLRSDDDLPYICESEGCTLDGVWCTVCQTACCSEHPCPHLKAQIEEAARPG